MSSTTSLKTPRLLLRPLEVADAAALWPFVSDPEVSRWMDWEPHRSLSETEAFLSSVVAARAKGTDLAWAIVSGGELVGKIGLHGITRTLRAWRVDRAELGYWLAPHQQGQGLVTEAARVVLRYGFRELGLHKVTVGCLEENLPSRRVIEKLGFRPVGQHREHVFRFERWWNFLSYELLANEATDAERADS